MLLLMLSLLLILIVVNVSVGSAFFVVAPSPSPPGLLAGHPSNALSPNSHPRMQASSLLRQPAYGGGLAGATERAAPAAPARGGGARGSGIGSGGSSSSSSRSSRSSTGSGDDIDLDTAMANARANLAEGRSPGAGLESAFDQADAAFADLIVTSVDDQGVTLDDQVRDRTAVYQVQSRSSNRLLSRLHNQ